MSLKQRFNLEVLMGFFVDASNSAALEKYLKEKHWLNQTDRIISVSRAGDGNMNLVLRVDTFTQSLIVKQSRPWVEKFPQIDAPYERAIIEGQFYQLIQFSPLLQNFTPRIIGVDINSSIIVLEDLGMYSDFTFIYDEEEQIDERDLEEITKFISLLHNQFHFSENSKIERITNKLMRQLNHEHLFVFPLEIDNGLDLDGITLGLQEISLTYKLDEAYKRKVLEIGKRYLEDGDTLLHGDYYPAAWMKTDRGVKIIDPEFCFFGHAEFDLGVFIAHLKMGNQGFSSIRQVLEGYENNNGCNNKLFCNFVGIEIMRRLIGIAQLHLSLDITQKGELLNEAYNLIMQPEKTELYNLAQSCKPCV